MVGMGRPGRRPGRRPGWTRPIKPIAPYVSLLPRVTAAHRPGTMRMAAWKASGTLDRGSFHAAAASSAALSQMTGAMLSRPQLALANPDGHRWNLPRKPGSHRTPRWREADSNHRSRV